MLAVVLVAATGSLLSPHS